VVNTFMTSCLQRSNNLTNSPRNWGLNLDYAVINQEAYPESLRFERGHASSPRHRSGMLIEFPG
jgi:hypothetical protein